MSEFIYKRVRNVAGLQRPNAILLATIAVAIALRVGVAFYLGNVVDAPPLLTDQRSYHALAVRLLAGEGFSFARDWYPFTPANTPTAHWSFLYSLLVAGVYGLFGAQPLAMRVAQATGGGILLPWLLYRLVCTMLEHRQEVTLRDTAPLFAAFVAAVYPYFILYAATLMTETLYIAALLWSLERSLRLARWLQESEARPPWRLVLSLGVSLGAAALLRQSFLPWVPVLFLYLLAIHRRTYGRLNARALAAVSVAGLVLVIFIVPWTAHNYRVYGEFLLLNSNTGYAMYSAQHPIHGIRFQEFEAAPLPDDVPRGNEAAADKMLLAQGFAFIWDEPGRYLLLSLSRVRAFFEFWPTPDTSLLHNLGRSASFGLLLPFIIYGLWLARRLPGFWRQNLLLPLFVVVYTVLHLLTWAMVRYRLPVDAVAMPFAALAMAEMWARVRKRYFGKGPDLHQIHVHGR